METTTTTQDFDATLEAFVRATEAAKRSEMDRLYPGTSKTLNLYTFSVERGSRYAKVITKMGADDVGRSAYCFVDITNGDILKVASWKAPAKGARGNIFRQDTWKLGSRYYR